MAGCSWNSLPAELKLHTIAFLEPESVKALSKVSYEIYELCVPTLFRVRLQISFATHAQLTNKRHLECHSEQL